MEYFVLMPEDGAYREWKKELRRFVPDPQHPAVISVEFDAGEILPDLLVWQEIFHRSFLISDSLKELVEVYDSTVAFTPMVLTSKDLTVQKAYWVPAVKEVDCLADKNAVGVSEISLKKEALDGRYLFRVRGIRVEALVVSLHLAEHMLRKDFNGIDYQPVPVL